MVAADSEVPDAALQRDGSFQRLELERSMLALRIIFVFTNTKV